MMKFFGRFAKSSFSTLNPSVFEFKIIQAKLSEAPDKPKDSTIKNPELTIGDAHANPLSLILQEMQFGSIIYDAGLYQQLYGVYCDIENREQRTTSKRDKDKQVFIDLLAKLQ